MYQLKFAIPVLLLLADLQPASVDDQAVASARCLLIGESPDSRAAPAHLIAPGAPPLLSFRVYEGKQHGRFGNTDLMLDDAGH